MQATGEFNDLLALMTRLRNECPWDKKQTNHSLIPYAIEETYELVEAIQNGDDDEIQGELGDVLLQVIFHAHLYQEQGKFDIADVIFSLQQKLIRRHPHVFDKENLTTDEAVKQRWNEIKAIEKRQKPDRKNRRILDTVKPGTALMQACDVQKTASKIGFDWENVAGAWQKLDEELAELKALINDDVFLYAKKPSAQQKLAIEDELGDCVFALVNVARKLGINSEAATLGTIAKFRRRFAFIEDELAKIGKTPQDSDLDEMDKLWDKAKSLENK
ncbi:nucleoside triphosphate pyrophosphohydrolase [Moraxella macacae 0408225]|uniref:Nucleoside triphosphate pyrophosphohydrolase n=1 Tax=Moraxella macacae 0408225 TaxID=1230338 RepID=L2F9Q8_9GAMM|nr:nucleoside triphosphate pyrophosphohydrolase [Moraxella macacae]ELA09203.1 nucleoside triphosphate pyrophosphohydrolase [Moraxella macacae 0408225]